MCKVDVMNNVLVLNQLINEGGIMVATLLGIRLPRSLVLVPVLRNADAVLECIGNPRTAGLGETGSEVAEIPARLCTRIHAAGGLSCLKNPERSWFMANAS